MPAVDDIQLDTQHNFFDWLWRAGGPVTISGSSAIQTLPDSFHEIRNQFEKFQVSICIPLITKAGLLGIIILGKKSGKDYSYEDLEILEILANHSALAIQNTRLQEHLRESKELESFYKLSTFVVHDLRNTVSILSMLSENAKVNMENLAFRDNLIKTLADSVDKMKEMLSRISLASKVSQISLKETDVNNLIKETLEDIELKSNYNLKLQFSKVPKILVDKLQLKKVLVNLILNAIEAMPSGGRLSIKTSHGHFSGNGQSVADDCSLKEFIEIAIADNGHGMSKEFIHSKLFKPFQTTKKKGLGIGLYHCKEIIESFGGRIRGTSAPERGSTFFVVLPIKAHEVSLKEDQLEKANMQTTSLTD